MPKARIAKPTKKRSARGSGPGAPPPGPLTLEQAQAELATLGRRAAADHPETHRHLRPQVMPYVRSIFDLSSMEAALLRSTNVFVAMLLVLVCGNVALLMFARAATREAERGTDAAWAALIAARTRLEAGVAGLKAADLALRGVRAEYGFGLRSTVDILIADQSYRGAQLDVARARADVLVAQAGMLRAIGGLTLAAYR